MKNVSFLTTIALIKFQRNIPISKGLLEDMLISLDMNLDEELDYKEMAQGMGVARREKREDRRKELSRESTSLSQRSGILEQPFISIPKYPQKRVFYPPSLQYAMFCLYLLLRSFINSRKTQFFFAQFQILV